MPVDWLMILQPADQGGGHVPLPYHDSMLYLELKSEVHSFMGNLEAQF